MTRKRMFRARGGWVLVEVLCGAVIVSLFAGQIIESAGMMARISVSGLETRTRSLDFNSIAGEVECTSPAGRVFRGFWQANADECESERGIGRVDVSVSPRSGESPETIRLTVWDIGGRVR